MNELMNFTEDNAKRAIIEARGDIFVASQMLGVTALRLDRAIQVSPVLQATLDSIPKQTAGVPVEEIHREVERRIAMYRVTGLDALHDLATMPLDENSAQNQVKLAAAARLAGAGEGGGNAGELGEALREMQESYSKNAPRLRVIRERMTIETIDEKEVPASPA